MKIINIAFMLSISLCCSTAHSAIINFEDVPTLTVDNIIVSGGFRFSSSQRLGINFNGMNCLPNCAANGTRTLEIGSEAGETTIINLRRDGGGVFNLSQLDAAELFAGPIGAQNNAIRIDYLGTLNGNAVSTGSFLIDQINDGPGGIADFQTFAVPNLTVDSFTFSGAGNIFGEEGENGYSLDNLVTALPNETEMPEPSTVALIALGALFIRQAQRQRRT